MGKLDLITKKKKRKFNSLALKKIKIQLKGRLQNLGHPNHYIPAVLSLGAMKSVRGRGGVRSNLRQLNGAALKLDSVEGNQIAPVVVVATNLFFKKIIFLMKR